MEIAIGYRTVLSLEVKTEASISVAKGRLWITRERDPKDYYVERGRSAALSGGEWLVQALAPSRFTCEDVAEGS
jgi:hypothetical protein